MSIISTSLLSLSFVSFFFLLCCSLLFTDEIRSFLQLLVGDIEVVSTTENIVRSIQSGSTASPTKITTTLHTAQPIQVDENDPILEKATKLDQLCTKDRDYYLLQSEAVSPEEYAKLSLGSETTTDDSSNHSSHVQQLSLPHCDDSISTTVSEESDCTVAIRVYDLNKRETKILRHDIIKRSRNPVGGDAINTFNNLGNCCNEIITTSLLNITNEPSDSPLQTTIQHFNSRILENANETRKPPRSPTKLKSTHLNRNPRKLKMADVQLMNDAFGTSLDPKFIEELKQQRQNNGDDLENEEIESSTKIFVSGSDDKNLVKATEQLLDSERESSKVCVVINETAQCQELEKPQPEENHQEEQQQQYQHEQKEEPQQQELEQQSEIAKQVFQTEKEIPQQSEVEETVAYAVNSTENGLVNESASDRFSNDVYSDAQNDQNHNGNHEFHVIAEIESAEVPTSKNDNNVTTTAAPAVEVQHPFDHVNDQSRNHTLKTSFERNHEVIVQVNEHKEKSVIEEDVIGALPSVKALARTFAIKNTTNKSVPEKLERPKVRLII